MIRKQSSNWLWLVRVMAVRASMCYAPDLREVRRQEFLADVGYFEQELGWGGRRILLEMGQVLAWSYYYRLSSASAWQRYGRIQPVHLAAAMAVMVLVVVSSPLDTPIAPQDSPVNSPMIMDPTMNTDPLVVVSTIPEHELDQEEKGDSLAGVRSEDIYQETALASVPSLPPVAGVGEADQGDQDVHDREAIVASAPVPCPGAERENENRGQRTVLTPVPIPCVEHQELEQEGLSTAPETVVASADSFEQEEQESLGAGSSAEDVEAEVEAIAMPEHR